MVNKNVDAFVRKGLHDMFGIDEGTVDPGVKLEMLGNVIERADPARHSELYMMRSELRAHAGDYEGAVSDIEDALRTAQTDLHKAEALAGKAYLRRVVECDIAASKQAAQEAIDTALEIPRSQDRKFLIIARAQQLLGQVHLYCGEGANAVNQLRHADENYADMHRSNPKDLEIFRGHIKNLSLLGRAWAAEGIPSSARMSLEYATALAQQNKDPRAKFTSSLARGEVNLEKGDLDEAAPYLCNARVVAVLSNYERGVGRATLPVAELFLRTGKENKADNELRLFVRAAQDPRGLTNYDRAVMQDQFMRVNEMYSGKTNLDEIAPLFES